jgi:hypothetical protein
MSTGMRSSPSEEVPAPLARVVKRCMETDPDERWQSARDLQWELESSAAGPGPASSRSSRSATIWAAPIWAAPVWAALGLVSLLLAALAYVYFREPSALREAARLTVLLP